MHCRTLLTAIVAAASLVLAAPAVHPAGNATSYSTGVAKILEPRQGGRPYQTYWGDGTANWPTKDQWVQTFDEMFNLNKEIMRGGCSWQNQANPSEGEINDMYTAIKNVAASSNVDPRVILAIVMQESNGCVRTKTTENGGVRNPGLMQSHNGAGTCWGVSPCQYWQIEQMIKDGTIGTAYGEGIQDCIAHSGASEAAAVYRAARLYNSGSWIPGTGLEHPNGATAWYSSTIANRLMGWVGNGSPPAWF